MDFLWPDQFCGGSSAPEEVKTISYSEIYSTEFEDIHLFLVQFIFLECALILIYVYV